NARRRQTPFLLRPLSLAASVFLLLGIGYGFFILFAARNPRTSPSAEAANARSRQPGSAVAASVDTTNPAAAASGLAAASPPAAYPNAVPPGRTRTKRHSIVHPNPAIADRAYTAAAPQSSPPRPLAIPDITRKKDSTKSFLPAIAMQPADNRLVYRGTITDQKNRPISGALLALAGNKAYTAITDQNGQFKLSLQPADTVNQLTIFSSGYDLRFLPLKTLSNDALSNNVIRLNPQRPDLDEVVVTGFGAHRKEATLEAPSDDNEPADSSWTVATPLIGRQAYLRYLDSAKEKLALDSTIKGTETISFLVSRNGSLTSFKIEHSLSPAHDAGILHIVSGGPAWLLLKGKRARASVTLTF
ncbi:MAG TPA: carboxypeptidase regulatory-like domain-containing protein, partial [Puia sp.]|nr:carboxypeptidase regulatory-like domain-containing protein [Puia sp.]